MGLDMHEDDSDVTLPLVISIPAVLICCSVAYCLWRTQQRAATSEEMLPADQRPTLLRACERLHLAMENCEGCEPDVSADRVESARNVSSRTGSNEV